MDATTVLERDSARQAVTTVLTAARSREGTTLFLVGEAGIGKTTLLGEACALSRDMGFSVVHARCSEVEASIPFGMIDRLFGELAGLPPNFSGDGRSPGDVFAARYMGLVDWLRLSAPPLLLLAVDDLQWSDPDSSNLLAALCRRLGGSQVAVVAATRSWPSAGLHQARLLVQDGFARAEYLQPLSEEASRTLLHARLGGRLPAELAGLAHLSCAGNPLLLMEVADAWARGENLLSDPGSLSERVFLPRFAGVAPDSLQWARGASVLGSRFHAWFVATLVGQGDREAVEALEELCNSGIVRESADGEAEFVHPLFRQALYDDMAIPVRQGLHARAFRLLQDSGAPGAEVAAHAVAAGLKGDPSALQAVLSSARAAVAAGAVAAGAEQFASAINMAGTASPPGVRLELGRACLLAGRIEQAQSATRRFLAEEASDDAGRVAGMRLLIEILMASARHSEAAECAEEASTLAGKADPRLAAEILLQSTFMGWVFEGPRRARATTLRVMRMIEENRIEDEDLRHSAQTADAYLACITGRPYGIDEMATEARRIMSQPDDHAHGLTSAAGWDPVFGYVNLAKIVERFEDAVATYPLLADRTRRSGAALSYWYYTINHADTLWRTGRLEEAYRLLSEGMAAAEVVPGIAAHASIGLAHISHEMARREESARWAEQVEAMMAKIGETAYLRLWLLLDSCRDELGDGRVDRAVSAAKRAAAIVAESGLAEPCVIPWHGAAIEAYAAAGLLDEAWELATSLQSLCEALPCQAPRAVAAAGKATVEWRRGHLDEAEILYLQALSHNAAVQMPLAEAETRVAFGRFLRHTGRPAEARAVLHRALEMLESTGAGRLTQAATAELAAAGGRSTRRPRGASMELTAQERRVASLAAKGLTNREIAQQLYVSAKTVDHHLCAVYAKLGLRSRRELMLRWDHGLGAEEPRRG